MSLDKIQRTWSNDHGGFNLFTIGLTAFLTLMNLFSIQSLLPTIQYKFQATTEDIGFYTNLTLFGMSLGSLLMAFLSHKLHQRSMIQFGLIFLSIPTIALAYTDSLVVFGAIRFVQGLAMSAIFCMTLNYLAERCPTVSLPAAFAAYTTGNVTANLIGRLSAYIVQYNFGLTASFYFFAMLNLLGGLYVVRSLIQSKPYPHLIQKNESFLKIFIKIKESPILICCLLGFCLLFIFSGVFTYVNFYIHQNWKQLDFKYLSLIHLVFLPALFTTPCAKKIINKFGFTISLFLGLTIVVLGIPLLINKNLILVIIGLMSVGVGTFFTQAVAMGLIAISGASFRGFATGIYLTSYFAGGLFASKILGFFYEYSGWKTTVGIISFVLLFSILLTLILTFKFKEFAYVHKK